MSTKAVILGVMTLAVVGAGWHQYRTIKAVPISERNETEVRTYHSKEFQKLVIGKSKKEIISLLGTPLSVDSGISPGMQNYRYSPAESYLGQVGFRVVDEGTGLTQQFVTISFSEVGYAIDIFY